MIVFGENVVHPSHYSGEVECIDAIKSCMTAEEFQGFLRGNCMKYLWRYKVKGGMDDLGKAGVYLEWLKKSYDTEGEHNNAK